MTAVEAIDQFTRRHAINWIAFQSDPMYRDLMECCRAIDPARAMPEVGAQSASEHSEHLLGRISGANLIINFLDHGIRLPVQYSEPEATWEEEKEEPKA